MPENPSTSTGHLYRPPVLKPFESPTAAPSGRAHPTARPHIPILVNVHSQSAPAAQPEVSQTVQPSPLPQRHAARGSPLPLRARDKPPDTNEAPPGTRKRTQPQPQPPPEDVSRARRDRIEQKRTIRAFVMKLIVIAALGYAMLAYVFGFSVMQGENMYPRVRDGDLMIYYRLQDSYTITDVVTFTRDGVRYTGRVVAKGGDKVALDETGQLLVNDNVQSEEIFYPTTAPENSGVTYPLFVPEDSLFLLCDMRINADVVDSRVYGCVRLAELDGKIITILRRRGI